MSLFFHRKQIEAAAAGTLEPEALQRLKVHLGGCAACRAHYDQAMAMRLALGGEGAKRERDDVLLAAVMGQRAPKKAAVPGRSLWQPALLAAVATVAVAVVVARPWHAETTLRGGGSEARPTLRVRLYMPAQATPILLGEAPASAVVAMPQPGPLVVTANGEGAVEVRFGEQRRSLAAARAADDFPTAEVAIDAAQSGTLTASDAAGHSVSVKVLVGQ